MELLLYLLQLVLWLSHVLGVPIGLLLKLVSKKSAYRFEVKRYSFTFWILSKWYYIQKQIERQRRAQYFRYIEKELWMKLERDKLKGLLV